MVNSISVHVIDRLQHLVHHLFDPLLWERGALAFDCFVHIHVHELEHQGQTAGGLIIEDFQQSDDVGVGGEPFQCLNFSEIIDLLHNTSYSVVGQLIFVIY